MKILYICLQQKVINVYHHQALTACGIRYRAITTHLEVSKVISLHQIVEPRMDVYFVEFIYIFYGTTAVVNLTRELKIT